MRLQKAHLDTVQVNQDEVAASNEDIPSNHFIHSFTWRRNQ